MDVTVPRPRTAASSANTLRTFRLAGFGGAGLFLRSRILPAGIDGRDVAALGCDVRLVAPDYDGGYLGREAGAGLVERLSAFLFRAGDDLLPEQTVPRFEDPRLGLALDVESSDGSVITLVATVVKDVTDADDVDVMNFTTSRYALVAAAEAVHALDGSDPEALAEEMPS